MRGALAIVLASLIAGCANDVVEGEASVEEGDVVGSSPASPNDSLGMGVAEARSRERVREAPAKPLGFACRKNAFCDDFEGAVPGARWSGSTQTNGGTIDFVTPSSTPGARSMRAQASSAEASAFLVLEGAALSSTWSGALAFSIRLDAAPQQAVGGPQILVPGPDGDETIGVSMRPDGIFLVQRGGAAERSDLVALASAEGEWARVVIGVEASGQVDGPAGSTFGRIEVSVDGEDNLYLPLVVAPFGGKVEVRAGITSPDTAPATARVDDVMFFTR